MLICQTRNGMSLKGRNATGATRPRRAALTDEDDGDAELDGCASASAVRFLLPRKRHAAVVGTLHSVAAAVTVAAASRFLDFGKVSGKDGSRVS